MTVMGRMAAVSALLLFVAHAAAQELTVLHIKVVLRDADSKAIPVPHHALLVSDNPATATPRRVVTGADGTADVRLRPGNYTVESDQPVVFRGKAYQWTQTLDVVAGRPPTLELTAHNAEVGSLGAATSSAAPVEADPSFLLSEWQASVVSIWTPTAHASGFVVDATGLVVTSGRAVRDATSVEVQLTRALKVAASVLASDPAGGVAVLRIDPAVAAKMRPLPLGCAAPLTPVAAGQTIYTIGALPLEPNDLTSGTVSRVEAHAIASDLLVPPGSDGGPVFAAGGVVVGMSSAADGSDVRRRGDSRVVPVADACAAVAAAEKKAADAAPPGAALPVEPSRPFPMDGLKDDAQHRVVALTPYEISASEFNILFITPPLLYAARHQADQAVHQERSGGARAANATFSVPPQLIEFGNWSEYVADVPPVLLVRVTPKLVEGFWTKVARGAAQTQGVAIPAITHAASGFSKLRVLCGDREVAPIHPFRLEQRMSETERIDEGLYVLDPDALTPSCASVTLELYSQNEPKKKADTRVVDPRMVQRIWDDFAPYRAVP